MKKRITMLVCVGIALVVSLVLFEVCVPEAESAPTPQYGGTFRLIRYVSPGTPIGCPWEVGGTDRAVSEPALESFLRVRLDLSLEPMLATSWKIAPDKSSITFTLRKGVKFHDGIDWNAEAAKFGLEAFKAAKKPGTQLWTSIKAVDDYTVQVTLSSWENTILEDIGTVLMISPAAFKTMGIDKIRWNPVGTGAFKFVSHERDVATKFVKFDGYWQKGKPYLDRLDLIVITDPVTQSAAMEAGQGDALWSPNIIVGADLKAKGFESIYRHDGPWSLVPDSANPRSPFVDNRVREALEYAIDREAIMKAFGYGFWQPAYQIAMPYNVAGYIPDFKGRKYDPDKARALLRDAGYPTGFKTKLIPYPGTAREIMAAVQSHLGKVGIVADIEFPDMAKFAEYRRKGWSNACFAMPWIGYAHLGRTFVGYVLSTCGDLVNLKRPAGLDELIKEAIATVEIEPQKLEKVVRMMFDEAVTIPCWYIGSVRSLRKGVVHDTGFLAYSSKDDWTPENTWLSK